MSTGVGPSHRPCQSGLLNSVSSKRPRPVNTEPEERESFAPIVGGTVDSGQTGRVLSRRKRAWHHLLPSSQIPLWHRDIRRKPRGLLSAFGCVNPRVADFVFAEISSPNGNRSYAPAVNRRSTDVSLPRSPHTRDCVSMRASPCELRWCTPIQILPSSCALG